MRPLNVDHSVLKSPYGSTFQLSILTCIRKAVEERKLKTNMKRILLTSYRDAKSTAEQSHTPHTARDTQGRSCGEDKAADENKSITFG